MITKNKKAQEEITGFALIIIIVAIMGLVILTFMLRKPSTSHFDNFEIQQFLDSVSRVQSQCQLPLENAPLRISDLIQECFSNSANSCQSGKPVCDSLKSSYQEIIRQSWNIAPSSPYTGFNLYIDFAPSTNSSSQSAPSSSTRILNLSQGTCGNRLYGGESILPEKDRAGNFISRMQLCLSNSTS